MWLLIGKILTNIKEDLWKYDITARYVGSKDLYTLEKVDGEYIFYDILHKSVGISGYHPTIGEAILSAMKLGYKVFIDDVEVPKPDLEY